MWYPGCAKSWAGSRRSGSLPGAHFNSGIYDFSMPNALAAESRLMTLLRRLGFERLAWSLRRLHCPVPPRRSCSKSGPAETRTSGQCASRCFRGDTSAALGASRQRTGTYRARHAERLPFKDKAFDFIIASHGSRAFDRFPQPSVRIAARRTRGYIEVPDAFMERVNRISIIVSNSPFATESC